MRIYTTALLLTCTVLLSSAFEALALPTFTITNVKHACGGQSNGSFQINVTAANAGSLRIRVIGVAPFVDIDQTITPTPGLPFVFPVNNVPGLDVGQQYVVIVSDPANRTDFVDIFDFTVNLDAVTQNTNPGCATPNGAINVTTEGMSPAGAIQYTWTGPGGPYTTEDITGLSGGDYSLSYTDGTTTCTLGPFHIDDPAPTPFIITSADPNICDGETLTVTVTSADIGWTYDVMDGATVKATAPGAGGVLNIPVPGLTTGAYTLRVRASAGVCPPRFNNPTDLAVTVNPTPDYNNHVSAGGICSTVAVGLDLLTLKKVTSVAATDYNITNIVSTGLTIAGGSPAIGNGLPASVIADDQWKNISNGPLDVTYTIVPVTNSCPGAPFAVTITINPQPDYNSYVNDALPGGVCTT
jgi:hypothetical protein